MPEASYLGDQGRHFQELSQSGQAGFCKNEFASLPGEFATVGKLSFIRKPVSHVELCSEKK
jgi:hypothetical protein